MEYKEFKRRILTLTREIPRCYSPGTLTANTKMILNRNEPSTARITVKSGPGSLGDPRWLELAFSSDTYAQDLANAKFMCFNAWRPTLKAFEREDVRP